MEVHEILIGEMPTKIYLDVENNGILCQSFEDVVSIDKIVYNFCKNLVNTFNTWINDDRAQLDLDSIIATSAIRQLDDGTFKYSWHIIVS